MYSKHLLNHIEPPNYQLTLNLNLLIVVQAPRQAIKRQASLEFEEFRKLAAIDMQKPRQKLKHENRAGRKFIRDTF